MPHAEPVPNAPLDHESDTVATPEGDNEFAPDQPLTPGATGSSVDGLKTPRGNAPQPYDNDRPNPTPPPDKHEAPTGLEKIIDEVSHGTLMP